jgi:aryl-alcohol dehydrogenase-like predicted oxidoreductase
MCNGFYYNLLYREEEREMLVLARGMLARGPALATAENRIENTMRAESDSSLQFYSAPQDQEIDRAVACMAEKRRIKPAQVALAWLLSKPALAAPIVGASKLHHVEDAAAAVEIVLTAEEIEQLKHPYLAKVTMGITPPFSFPKAGAVHDRDVARA